MKYYIIRVFIFLNIIYANPFEGLTLITTMGGGQNSSDTYLIDNNENIFHCGFIKENS